MANPAGAVTQPPAPLRPRKALATIHDTRWKGVLLEHEGGERADRVGRFWRKLPSL
jgi:hypothetical protein